MGVFFSLTKGIAQDSNGPTSYDYVVKDRKGITVAMFMSEAKALDFIDKVEKLMEIDDRAKMEATLQSYHFDLEQQKLVNQTWTREHEKQ